MRLDSLDPGFPDDPLEFTLPEVVHLEGITQRVPAPEQMSPFLGKNQTMIMVIMPVAQLDLCLMLPVLPDQAKGLSSEVDCSGSPVLGRAEQRLRSRPDQLLDDPDLAGIQIHA